MKLKHFDDYMTYNDQMTLHDPLGQLQLFMFCTWRQLPCDVMQKGKGKAAAASAASQPQLATQAMESEDSPQLAQDIVVTSELLERFNAHADVWEALEVRQTERTKKRKAPWKC